MFREGLNYEIQDEIATTSNHRTWRALLIWPFESRAASSCVSDAWLPARPGGWRKPSLSRAIHHLSHPWRTLSPCSWGAFDVSPRETTKAGSGSLPLLREAGSLCSILSFKSQGPLVNRGVLVGVSPLIFPQSRTQLSATITYQDSAYSCKSSYWFRRWSQLSGL